MSEQQSTTGDAALAVVIRVLGAGLVFGLQVLLARLLPEDGYGGFVTLWTWMLALGSFAALGFAESSVRFLPRYQVRSRHEALGGYWRFGLKTVCGAGLGVLLLAAALAFWLGLDGPNLTVVLILLGLPILGLEYYLEGVARSFGWFRLAAVPVYILRPILIGLVCLGLTAAGVDLTLPVVGGVLIGSMGVVVLLMWLLLARRLRSFRSGRGPVTRGQGRLWLAASLPLLVLSGLDDLVGYADVLVLSLLSEPEIVAVYFAAARALALAGFVAYAMTLVAGRQFAVSHASADRAQLQRGILQSTRLTLWATVVSVVLALAASPLLLRAFGEAYLAGQPVMLVLGLGMIVRAMAGQAGEVLIVLGRQRQGLIVGLGILLIMAVLGVLLVPVLGGLGAAIASATAMVCRTAALSLLLWRTERLQVFSLGLPTFASASVRA